MRALGPFKIETNSILTMTTPDCCLAKVDIKHAYYFISILPEHQEYFKLLFRGKLYQFTCFPNDLSVFMKVDDCFRALRVL